ncbi:head GIN domain-containing protein [Flavobacterium sp. GNP001]
MLKLITIITKFIAVVLTALLLGSCNHNINFNSIEGSGNITTQKRNISGSFTSIEVNNSIEVILEQGDKTEVVVETDDNLQKHLTTTVENGTLVITLDEISISDASELKVTVKMPTIDELEATSTASIESVNLIIGENVRLNTSSGGSINIEIESDMLSCDSSSGSDINVQGKALKVKTSASSGSEIKANELLANEVIADVSSGASTSVHPIVSLVAEASSGGSITYYNTPKRVQKNTSSGGSINRQE